MNWHIGHRKWFTIATIAKLFLKPKFDCIGEILVNSKHFSSAVTKVMITTGWPKSSATKTEIVDVVYGENCADLADFPWKIESAVGVNLHGTPAVCGGWSSNYIRKCYKFKNGGWEVFASMKEKRRYASGVVYDNKFHIFGGRNGSTLRSSEIISIDGGVEYGPDLPKAVYNHAITAINTTVSILSGGSTSASLKSSSTWYYNHETQVFSSGPSLLERRREHGSATIVDMVTKSKIPIVTGGLGNGFLKSTEMLINGQWQPGMYYKLFLFISL